MTPTRPVVGFLTDFGLDGAAAICRAVILSICRDAQIVDICHTVGKYGIAEGAYLLRTALPWFPVGVHLAVVDPGVGTARRPIGIRTARGDLLIGPDNGLLVPAAEALGGVDEARELANRDLMLPTTSATFHGRDIFAPIAAHLALGTARFDTVGPVIGADDLARLTRVEPRASAGRIEAEVAYVDSFGNLRLAAPAATLGAAFGATADGRQVRVRVAGTTLEAVVARTFGNVPAGTALVYVDSSGDVAVAVGQGNLAQRIDAGVGSAVVIETAV